MIVPIHKNKGNRQSCNNYRDIKFLRHTIKLWEKVIKIRLQI